MVVRPVIFHLLGVLFLFAGSTSAFCANMAPDFSLPRIDGSDQISLSSLRGKVVYVDFWASWCAPCALSLPALQQLHAEFKADGFEVLAINLDETPAQANQFLQTFEIQYPVLFDANKTTPTRYALSGMPTAYLVDRNGVLRAVHKGFKAGDAHKLKQQIQQLLQETSP